MTTQNPATPAAPVAATPGSDPNVVTPPSTPTTPVVPEGKVTIDTKEYAQLQRDAARVRSVERRRQINAGRPPVNDGGNPDIAQAVQEANDRAAQAERVALQAEARNRTRDILDRDEFKTLPKSTKDIILKNPALLSQADNLEEAMLDIEDFVRESVASMGEVTPVVVTPAQPVGHDAPPVVNNGAPAPAGAVGDEDISKLSGPARSQAMIRNTIRNRGKK